MKITMWPDGASRRVTCITGRFSDARDLSIKELR